ncbi:ribosome biogenesis protein SLX9-domain-containing protein [Lipomyces kononenkoae]|uniref:Ribosome biogenesis protein SLX9-domain-containing protein n=1 Tax=Lipomyces kononenkoae TaxID=34357 RepID=A0ACC3TCC1_LIPKO
MAPRRKSADAIVEARQALREHTNALKLAAAEATIARSALNKSKSRALATRTGGRISKPTKDSKLLAKRARFLNKVTGGTSDDAVAATSAKRTRHMTISRRLNDVKVLSKSARRRSARANKEKLAGSGMNDLLDALPSDTVREMPAVDDNNMNVDEIRGQQKHQDQLLSSAKSKPASQKQNEKTVRQEIDRFGKVIAVRDFRDNPFSTLRSFIQNRI